MRGRAILLGAVAAGLMIACESSTESNLPDYIAGLSPMKENPAITTSTATGEFTATLSGNTLTYNFTFTGLGSNSTLAHIHGPATAPTQNVGVLINFDDATNGRTFTVGATSGTGSGTVDLSPTATTANVNVNGDSLRKLLDAGRLYVNVHSVNFGGGEIRGTIVRP
jgi:hypothetical protein